MGWVLLRGCISACHNAWQHWDRGLIRRGPVIHQSTSATLKREHLLGDILSARDHTLSDCHALLKPKREVSQHCFMESMKRANLTSQIFSQSKFLAISKRQFQLGLSTGQSTGKEYTYHVHQWYGYHVHALKPGPLWNGFPDSSKSTPNLSVWIRQIFMDFTNHKMTDQCRCFSLPQFLRSTVQILHFSKSLAVITISPKSSLSKVTSWCSPLSPLPSLVLRAPNIPDTCLTHLNSPVTNPKRSPQKAFRKSLNEYEWMTKWGQHMALWQLCQMHGGAFHLLPILRCVPGLCGWWRVGAWSSVWRTLFILTIPTERIEKDI